MASVLERPRTGVAPGDAGVGSPSPAAVRSRRPVARAVATFAVSGLAALVLVGVIETVMLRGTGTTQAIREARRVSQVVAHGIVEPQLSEPLLRGDPAAIAALDQVVRDRVLDGTIVRVKLWEASGRVVYSDQPGLIGQTFPLEADKLEALRSGQAAADLSDLSAPESRSERSFGRLLEVYLPVQTPGGTRILFEAYLRFSSVAASGDQVWRSFVPALLGGLAVLALLQVPLAWGMARRLERGRRERERLLRRAVEASAAERRRIAGDLHDGVVQDFAGLSMLLAAAAERAETGGATDAAEALRSGAARTRQGMRQLRTLLVSIYPPSLHTAGLEAAMSDLLAPLAARGLRTSLEVAPGVQADHATEALVFRTAQEAVRNVLAHADATSVEVRLAGRDGALELMVRDDGRGFSAADLARRGNEGHLGLALLAGLVEESGGRLDVDSEPEEGTTVRLEVPLR